MNQPAIEVTRTYTATTLLNIPIPTHITITTYYDLYPHYRDPCFYPEGIIATVEITNTPILIEIFNGGETSVTYYPTPDDEPLLLTNCDELRAHFPRGDVQISTTLSRVEWDQRTGTWENTTTPHTTPHILEWNMNPWYDLYQANMRGEKTYYPEHLDAVSHDIVDALQDAISEAQTWEPYLPLLEETCPEAALLQAVLSPDRKAREAALSNSSCPASVRTAAALTT